MSLHYEDYSAAIIEAARIAVECYAAALEIPETKIPTPLHGAMAELKQTLEAK